MKDYKKEKTIVRLPAVKAVKSENVKASMVATLPVDLFKNGAKVSKFSDAFKNCTDSL